MAKVRFTNLKSFNKQLAKFAEHVELAPEIVAKEFAFELFGFIIGNTHPVDTGYARGNWNLAPKRPDESVKTITSEAMAKDANAQMIKKNQGIMSARWWITNNVEYIVYLEEPSANINFRGAGEGHMVKRALANQERFLQAAIDEFEKGLT